METIESFTVYATFSIFKIEIDTEPSSKITQWFPIPSQLCHVPNTHVCSVRILGFQDPEGGRKRRGSTASHLRSVKCVLALVCVHVSKGSCRRSFPDAAYTGLRILNYCRWFTDEHHLISMQLLESTLIPEYYPTVLVATRVVIKLDLLFSDCLPNPNPAIPSLCLYS